MIVYVGVGPIVKEKNLSCKIYNDKIKLELRVEDRRFSKLQMSLLRLNKNCIVIHGTSEIKSPTTSEKQRAETRQEQRINDE